MKSKHCPLRELHAEDPDFKTEDGCFAHSSSIQYIGNRLKSHRRRDSAVTDAVLRAIKERNRLVVDAIKTCASC